MMYLSIAAIVVCVCYRNRKVLFPWFCKETLADTAVKLARKKRSSERHESKYCA